MRLLKLTAILAAATAIISSTAVADSAAPTAQIGVVNLRLAYDNLQETIDSQRELNEMQKQYNGMVKADTATMAAATQPAAGGNTPALPQDEADAKLLDLNKKEQTLKLQAVRKQCSQMARAYEQMEAAIADIAKARNLNLVVVTNNRIVQSNTGDMTNVQAESDLLMGRDLLYQRDEIDITDQVIGAVNKGYHSTAPALPALPMASIKVGSKTFQLEIAGDDASREHGLMERDTLAPDHGMIFVFPDLALRTFWMRHTRFPLDIVFTDDHGKVVSVVSEKAYDETGVSSDEKAKYALELPAGSAALVKVGDTISIPREVDAALKK